MSLFTWKAYKYISKLFSREKLAEWLNSVLAVGDNKEEGSFGVFATLYMWKKIPSI